MANYVHGSAARKQPQKQKRKYKKQSPTRKKHIRAAARRNRQKALSMNASSVFFLSLCVCIIVGACSLVIYLQSNITNRLKRISKLESDLFNLKGQNDELEKEIKTSIDFKEIERLAKEELNMDYPTDDQIIYYSIDNENYMEQYEDIAEK